MGMDYIVDIFEDMDDACEDAVEWLRESSYPTLQEAWDACPRGDWMLWLIPRCPDFYEMTHRQLVLASCDCAELSQPMWRPKDANELRGILNIVRAWACGEAHPTEVERAANALRVGPLVSPAARAVQHAAWVVWWPEYAAVAVYAPPTAAGPVILQQAASIVRRYFPDAPSWVG